MPNRCIVAGCSKTPKDDVSLHNFPKDENLRKIWIAKVKLTRAEWQGPSEWSTICSDHFAVDDFENPGLYSEFGMKKRRSKLKDSAIPTIRFGVKSSKKQDLPTRPAAVKRERKRVLDEALSQASVDEAGFSHWSADTKDPNEGSPEFETDFLDEPACSYSVTEGGKAPIVSQQGSVHLMDMQQQPETVGGPSQSSGTQRSVATRVKRIQTLSVHMCDRGTQYFAPEMTDPERTKGTMCNIPQEEKVKEQEMMEVEEVEDGKQEEEEISSDDKHETSDYLPESSESSSDYQSTPQKPRKKLCKTRVGRSPAVAVKPGMAVPPHEEKKYIVFEGKLMELLRLCRDCRSGNVNIMKREMGTMAIVSAECYSCGKMWKWESQPYFHRTPAGNVLLSASTLFAGGSWKRVEQILGHLRVACISEQTFYVIQRTILQPVIEKKWVKDQQKVVQQLVAAATPLTLAGDGRADSPGHSAKYGVYTGLEVKINKIVDLELVQSNEVKSSYHMELEGFKRLQAFLASNGLDVGKLITDRHLQLAKYVRENSPTILHTYDVWHLAKSVQKKIHALAKQKGFEDLLVWERSITNHVYWVASSTKDEEGDLREAKWTSLVNHVQGIHEGHSELFPRCLHGDLQGERPRKWLKTGTMVTEKLDDVVTKTILVKDIKKMSSGDQTSSLESFHAVINQFAPKMRSYKYHGMLSRLHLAALHYNANSDRKQATTKKGEKRYAISKPKYKPGAASAKAVKEPRIHSYVVELMADISEYESDASPLPRQPSPPPLTSGHVYPSREEIIQRHRSRFSLDQ